MLEFKNLGVVEYNKAYDIQLQYLNENIRRREQGQQPRNIVLYVEHPHVYTLGKNGDRNNLLASDEKLKEINATFVRTDRGGDITYHGYGQQVIYPVFDLYYFGIMVRRYIQAIEEVIIRTLRHYGIEGKRLEGAPGIWLYGDGRPVPEKICAIGVRISRGVTMHGLAFNVNTDLSYFDYINPCGFTDKGVTSMQRELGHRVSMAAVRKVLSGEFESVFGQIRQAKVNG